MDELNINYNALPKSRKITNIIIGIYLTAFCFYFAVTEAIANQFDALFFISLIGIMLAAILLLSSTVWVGSAGLYIDSTAIQSALAGKDKINIEWVNVSEINIGVSYIVFQTRGGQKQTRLDLSSLIYTDMVSVKSKLIELSQFKNIPYKND